MDDAIRSFGATVSAQGRQALPLPPTSDPETIPILETIAQRVLWLSTYMIHYANKVRPNPDGMKVGGHQASCASVVSLMTALYFAMLRPQDHVAVKPHASPVLHAIQYLLGRLPQHMLTTLRDFGGLQAYPSRTKDPDGVTIATGSVGLGAAATIFGALATSPWSVTPRSMRAMSQRPWERRVPMA